MRQEIKRLIHIPCSGWHCVAYNVFTGKIRVMHVEHGKATASLILKHF